MKRDSLLSVVTEPCLFSQIPPSNQLQGLEAGKNRLPSLEAPTVAQSAAPCRGAGPLGMRSAPPVTYEHAPGASNSPEGAHL